VPVGVHAEFDPEAPRAGSSVRDFLDSRPIESECAAIAVAIEMAGETGCALHVVHVSSARGLALITDARAKGVNVTAETCPHYLVFTGEDMERLGAVAKCAPPMRDTVNRTEMWERLRAGGIHTIGSDHSPSPWSMKTDPDFFKVWGGISGIQHLLPVLLDAGLEPARLAALAAANPARRFRLRGKGEIAVGADADLALVEMGAEHEVRAESLLYRHRHSPFVGRKLRARVRRTIRRGETVFGDGAITANGKGQFLKRTC
jgi:allantoinase